MLQAFVITLREGLEAFLIVAICLAYLRKTGRHQLVPAVHWGIGVSVLVSIGAASAVPAREQSGAVGRRAGADRGGARRVADRAHVAAREAAQERDRDAARVVSAADRRQGVGRRVPVHAADDYARRHGDRAADGHADFPDEAHSTSLPARRRARSAAAFVAWLWSRYGHRVNLALFFQVTAVFLAVFVVQLLIYGFHELTEANLFPYSEPLHWATEPYGPDGRYGQYLTYLLVLLPMGWLAFAALFAGRRSPPRRSSRRLRADGQGRRTRPVTFDLTGQTPCHRRARLGQRSCASARPAAALPRSSTATAWPVPRRCRCWPSRSPAACRSTSSTSFARDAIR